MTDEIGMFIKLNIYWTSWCLKLVGKAGIFLLWLLYFFFLSENSSLH